MQTFRYPAVRFVQVAGAKPLLLFAAPCHEISDWAGIPRKEAPEGGVESVGFQRAAADPRLKKLGHFLSDEGNIIANPILCAARIASRFNFTPHDGSVDPDAPIVSGTLEITEPDYANMTLIELLRELELLLRQRKPELSALVPDEDEIGRLMTMASVSTSQLTDADNDLEEDLDEDDSENERHIDFSTDRHIDDYYRGVLHRRVALERAATGAALKEFAGFSRSALCDYLRAATIVDGQHRLLGAQRQLDKLLTTGEEARRFQDELLAKGANPSSVKATAQSRYARRLGVALILNEDWSEHVFQFVVVNQKATPIPNALLASIVATTLTQDEVDRITERLGRADIPVVDYQVISYLESSPESPFRGWIKRGYEKSADAERKLDFSVADRLADIFRFLRGGKYFHDRDVDYAKKWAETQLRRSKIVEAFKKHGFTNEYKYWSSPAGPWRQVFCSVWSVVRDQLADINDPTAANFWGSPKTSNLFNDVHLTILAADFFCFMTGGRGIAIDSQAEVEEVTREWLGNGAAKKEYFARDYGLKSKGAKKSEGAIKKLWSGNWRTYREKGYQRLIDVRNFVP